MEKNSHPRETSADKRKFQIHAVGRTAWIMFLSLLLVLALVSTFVAFFQAPGRNPAEHPAFPSLEWFMQPIEQNAELRLPAISSHLNDVFVVPGTSHVWAVGDTGMILHSPDAGITWKRVPEEQPQKEARYTPGDGKAISLGDFNIRLPDLTRKAYAEEAPKKIIQSIEQKAQDTSPQQRAPIIKQFSPEQNTNIRQSATQSFEQPDDADRDRRSRVAHHVSVGVI